MRGFFGCPGASPWVSIQGTGVSLAALGFSRGFPHRAGSFFGFHRVSIPVSVGDGILVSEAIQNEISFLYIRKVTLNNGGAMNSADLHVKRMGELSDSIRELSDAKYEKAQARKDFKSKIDCEMGDIDCSIEDINDQIQKANNKRQHEKAIGNIASFCSLSAKDAMNKEYVRYIYRDSDGTPKSIRWYRMYCKFRKVMSISFGATTYDDVYSLLQDNETYYFIKDNKCTVCLARYANEAPAKAIGYRKKILELEKEIIFLNRELVNRQTQLGEPEDNASLPEETDSSGKSKEIKEPLQECTPNGNNTVSSVKGDSIDECSNSLNPIEQSDMQVPTEEPEGNASLPEGTDSSSKSKEVKEPLQECTPNGNNTASSVKGDSIGDCSNSLNSIERSDAKAEVEGTEVQGTSFMKPCASAQLKENAENSVFENRESESQPAANEKCTPKNTMENAQSTEYLDEARRKVYDFFRYRDRDLASQVSTMSVNKIRAAVAIYGL
jgi:hypothetical protein